jgi:hypothetical protein
MMARRLRRHAIVVRAIACRLLGRKRTTAISIDAARERLSAVSRPSNRGRGWVLASPDGLNR